MINIVSLLRAVLLHLYGISFHTGMVQGSNLIENTPKKRLGFVWLIKLAARRLNS